MATEDSNPLTSLPTGTPAILRRHPALLVEWLRVANSLARWREERSRTAVVAFGAIAAVVVVVLVLAVVFGHAAPAIEMLARYWVLVGVVTAVYAFTSVNRQRRHLEDSQSQSWLIATPISPSSLRVSHAIRTLLPLAVMFTAAVMVVACVLLFHGGVAAAAGTTIATIGGGLLFGGAAGWWLAGRARARAGAGMGAGTDTAASRYVPRLRVMSRVYASLARCDPVPTAWRIGPSRKSSRGVARRIPAM